MISKNRNDSKKLWSIIHKITGKLHNKKEISGEFVINGVKERNSQIISNAFAEYYSGMGRSLARDIESKGSVQNPINDKIKRVDNNCFLFPVTVKEIEKHITSLKVKNSKGHDEVTNKILKCIYPGLIKALLIVFNKSLCQGIFPSNMKLAVVKPLYKSKSKTEMNNYRPVSLLPVISKILEKLLISD